MLYSLHIENIAVIKCVDIDFESGFTALTGETGAGKSILIDSINFLLGARTSKDILRSGEDKATVSAMFGGFNSFDEKILSSNDIQLDEDGNLLVGSIAVCVKRASEQAEEYGHSLERELHYLIVHGVMHCLGYDHIEDEDRVEMREKEEYILGKLGITRA